MTRTKPQGGSAVLATPGGRRPVRRAERVAVLVVLHADGAVEVYGDRDRVDVTVANLLAVERAAEEHDAEDYMEAGLPERYRSLYMPGRLLAMGHVRDCLTPEAELGRRVALDLLRACRSGAERSRA